MSDPQLRAIDVHAAIDYPTEMVHIYTRQTDSDEATDPPCDVFIPFVWFDGVAETLDRLRALFPDPPADELTADQAAHLVDTSPRLDIDGPVLIPMPGSDSGFVIVAPASPVEDRRPHSRACGWEDHPHGPRCHRNCPTCYGR